MDEETVFVSIDELVRKLDDFRDTDPMGVPAFRAGTCSDWPPEPPMPADDLAQGTISGGVAPVRKAGFYAAVPRPTTSSDDDT